VHSEVSSRARGRLVTGFNIYVNISYDCISGGMDFEQASHSPATSLGFQALHEANINVQPYCYNKNIQNNSVHCAGLSVFRFACYLICGFPDL